MAKREVLGETAPMAGYTDLAFRRVLIKCGARAVWTEMVSAAAIYYGNKKTLELLKFDKKKNVRTVVQLFGKNAAHFEYAIQSGLLDGFDEININMGCPANKILKNGEGVALMQKPELAKSIIETCVRVSKVPVSVKMRLDNIMEISKICEQCGVSRIIIHGRYGKQGYSGKADWSAIAEVVRAVGIPVVANGDVKDAQGAKQCLDVTSAAGVMIGRSLIGAPWMIMGCKPKESEIKKIIMYHVNQAKKRGTNPNEMKKHLLLYKKHIPDICEHWANG